MQRKRQANPGEEEESVTEKGRKLQQKRIGRKKKSRGEEEGRVTRAQRQKDGKREKKETQNVDREASPREAAAALLPFTLKMQ